MARLGKLCPEGDHLGVEDSAGDRSLRKRGAFVGREHEMAVLTAAINDAFAGLGRLVLLVGEPGIGKTRLAAEAATYASAREAHVFWGYCRKDDGAPGFWPWVQIVRACAQKSDPAAILSELDSGATDIGLFVPELSERLSGSRAVPAGPDLGSSDVRFRVFDSLARFFGRLAEIQPLVIALDDLHWADTPSLVLLEFLARELRSTQIVLIGTYRDVGLGPGHPLAQTLAEIAGYESSQRLYMSGLSEQDVAHFMGRGAEGEAGALVRAVHQKTEGNPFFVTELVHLLATDSRLAGRVPTSLSLKVPDTVREVIRHRLDYLSDECNRMLTVASAIGREFSLKVVSLVTALSTNRLLDLLDEAKASRVVVEVDGGFRNYRFSHVLFRDALYEGLSASRQVALHGTIGRIVEELHDGDLTSSVAQLAYHFSRAIPDGDASRAVDYGVLAGKQATDSLAYEDAVTHYRRALDILGSRRKEASRRCEILLALGDAQNRAGCTIDARDTFLKAANLARSQKAAEKFCRAAIGFGWEITTGFVDEELVSLLGGALHLVGKADSVLRVELLSRYARALYWSDRREQGVSLSQQAVEMAERIADTSARAVALTARYATLWGPDRFQNRIAVTGAIERLARETRDKEIAIVGKRFRILDLLEEGSIASVDAEIESHARLASEIRQPLFMCETAVFRGMRALIAGRFEEVENSTKELLAKSERGQHPLIISSCTAQIFGLRCYQGRLSELESRVRGLGESFPALPVWRSALAFLYAECNRPEARTEFERLASNGFTGLPRDGNWLITMALLSEVCAQLGEMTRAEMLYDLLTPFSERNVVIGYAAVCDGPVSHYLGRLAHTLSRWEDAAGHFEHALHVNSRMEAQPLMARTQHRYAEMLLARKAPGDQEKADELIAQATTGFQQFGMKAHLGRVLALVSTNHQPCSPRRRVHVGPDKSPSDVKRTLRGADRGMKIRKNPSRRAKESTPAQSEAGNCFRREGDYWTVTYDGRVSHVKNSKGLQQLAHLLRNPDEEIHVMELVAALTEPVAFTDASVVSDREIAEYQLRISRLGDNQPILDARARQQYQRRLDELFREADEAEQYRDVGKSAQAHAEIEMITSELRSVIGRGGRSRAVASAMERARISVRNNIAAAMKAIQQNDKNLWRHLFSAVRTGASCSYRPDRSIIWNF